MKPILRVLLHFLIVSVVIELTWMVYNLAAYLYHWPFIPSLAEWLSAHGW